MPLFQHNFSVIQLLCSLPNTCDNQPALNTNSYHIMTRREVFGSGTVPLAFSIANALGSGGLNRARMGFSIATTRLEAEARKVGVPSCIEEKSGWIKMEKFPVFSTYQIIDLHLAAIYICPIHPLHFIIALDNGSEAR